MNGPIYLTVDVEDYYHAEVFSGIIDRSDWGSCVPHVVANTTAVLDLFRECSVRGTFFVLGNVAEKNPGLIKAIQESGNEVASHGYGHRMLTKMSREEFREDLRKSRKILEDITGEPVIGYRAPTFSIVKDTAWAYEILRDEGFRYSSSVYPIRHDRYGWTEFGLTPGKMAVDGERFIWELPMSVMRMGPLKLPFGGGGYLRLYPLFLTKYFFGRLIETGRPSIVYVHPWEFDLDHPKVAMPALKRFRHQVGISGAREKMRDLLKTFSPGRMDRFLKDADALLL